MVEKRKELEIPEELMEEEWKSNKVVIKRLSYGEFLRTRDEAARIKIHNSGMDGTVKQEIAAIGLLVKAIVEAPWQVNSPAALADLDANLGTWLSNEVNDFISVKLKKKGSSKAQPEQEDQA